MTWIINGYVVRGVRARIAEARRLPDSLHCEFAIKKTKSGFMVVRSNAMTTGSFMGWQDGYIPVGSSDKIKTEEQLEDAIAAVLSRYYPT